MKNIKNSLFYLTITGGFITLMFWIVSKGKILQIGREIVAKSSTDTLFGQFLDSLVHNLKHPLAILLLQIILQIMFLVFY